MEQRSQNPFKVAAKGAIQIAQKVELSNWIGMGPSIRARARLALVTSFFVVVPTVFLGVWRTSHVSEQTILLSEYDSYYKQVTRIRFEIESLKYTYI